MPRQSTLTEIRVTNIIECLTLALTLLKELNDAFGPPFIQSIANTIESVISMAQLMENIHPVLYAIINLYLKSETVESLAPEVLHNIGKFMETLHKIYTFVKAQQDGTKLKHLFRNHEMQNLLEGCHAGLAQAVEVFKITTRPAMISEINAIKKTTQLMHEELLELIQTQCDVSTASNRSSPVHPNSVSTSFSMLPSRPKIFHGRKSEVENIMKMLTQESPRIAILGGGGMGKTSLARAVLHHPDTPAKFENRFFVSAESATTSIELAALIGLHVGLKPGPDLTRPVVLYLSHKPSCLLVLDNLETVWEPIQSRSGIEEFLALLTAVKHLALIITMRGAERPGKVHWTHPFLLPLQPLSAEAAQQTFMDITDNVYRKEEIVKILQFTENMPLAVDLIAHLSDYEGLSNVLARWDTERTALLSVGYDRKSNLDASIQLSLSSPRITSNSKELLSLLSILPDGLSDAELLQSKLPIPNILSCKSVLLATSLAYQDSNQRLRSLMPVREHIQQFLPPSTALVKCLYKLFYALLELYKEYNGEQLGPVMNEITQNLANFQEVLQRGLYDNALDLKDTIYSISILCSFYRITGRGGLALIEHIQSIVPGLADHHLKIQFMTQVLLSYDYYPTFDREQVINEGMSILELVNNPLLESKFYNALGLYFINSKFDRPQAMQFYQRGLKLAKMCPDSNPKCEILINIAWLQILAGQYCTAQVHASEVEMLSQISANLYHEASALWIEAMCLRSLGDFRQSADQLQRSRTMLGICGLANGELDHEIAIGHGEIHLQKSEYAEARKIYHQVVEANSPEQDPLSYAISVLNIAHIATLCGDTRAASHDLNQAKDILSTSMVPRDSIRYRMVEAEIELTEEKFEIAKVKLKEILTSLWGQDNEIELFCLGRLADIRAWPASEWHPQWPVMYCACAYKSKDKLELHEALLFLGDVFLATKDDKTATNLYIVALEGFTHMGVHRSQAQCMVRLGDLAKKQGQTSKAIGFWRTARPLFEQSLQAKDVAQIDVRLSTVDKAHQKSLLHFQCTGSVIEQRNT
ncbi:hypothetical protein DFH08DRAFT_945519 [Mycena albidolilacea]|uniref:Novel STAND NTPase 1 domain-containing protein n=1 Tax=Mycena albidolilacea TaxID=1033008 RepID=A0AAD7E952_9AGAR|nr:hypothetical protein DFH08DRAFT_945519 [Mycena albidolilacea]